MVSADAPPSNAQGSLKPSAKFKELLQGGNTKFNKLLQGGSTLLVCLMWVGLVLVGLSRHPCKASRWQEKADRGVSIAQALE
jgi:hypothetical protein